MYNLLKCLLLSLALIAPVTPAHAALIELTPEASGSIRVEGGAFGAFARHTTPLTSIRGYQVAMAQGVDYASYLIFDTATPTFTPLYGTLVLEINDTLRDLAGPGPLNIWGLDTFTPASLMALPTGSINALASLASSISSDLRGGTSLAGSVLGPQGVVSIALNSAALAQITSANGLWGMGLYDNRFGALLGGLNLLSAPRLILSDEAISLPVPVPATTLLVSVALALLAARRRSLFRLCQGSLRNNFRA